MIKKSVFEDELIYGMQRELQGFDKTAAMNNLPKAAEYLHSALEIFEEAGLTSQADQLLSVLQKIGQDEQYAKSKVHRPKNPTKISDPHVKGLTPDRMIENLKHHGIVFNMADDGKADDLLEADVTEQPLEVNEDHEKDFEDE